MRHAVELAGRAGVGMVATKRSTHCGALAYYAFEACQADMLGLAFTHATPKVRSPGSTRPFVGTNPMCFAAPMQDEGPFCFDAAPTPLTSNAIKRHREAGQPLPPGSAADAEGRPTLDPEQARQLLPIGDYKGFGWALMVDVLCGLLSGMPVGNEVSSMYDGPLSSRRNLGQFFAAIRIDGFESVDTFKQRLQEFADRVRAEPRADPGVPVQAPGDPEKAHEAERLRLGIPLAAAEHRQLDELAERLDLEPLTARTGGDAR
jgi:ureidoglycolate dehydrogenase (NAD+)